MTVPPVKQFDLLCENCGYVLSGLDRDGACPECGRPIAQSLPSARTLVFGGDTGTTWGQFVRRLAFDPRGAVENLRIDTNASNRFAKATYKRAGVVASLGVPTIVLFFSRSGDPDVSPAFLIPTTFLMCMFAMLAATFFTYVVLWNIGAIARGMLRDGLVRTPRKLPEAVARVVIDTCSVSWLVGAGVMTAWNVVYGIIAKANPAGMLPATWIIGWFIITALSTAFWLLSIVLVARRFRFANAPGAY